jgi:hypothetical protein
VVDGDDWMELDGIERLVDEQIATDADVVWGKALMHNEDGVVELIEPRYKDLEEWRMCYFGYEWELKIVNWRRIIRRDLLERYHIRHEEGQHIGNDKQLMPLIAYYAQSFSTVDAIVYHYERRNPHAHTYMNHHHHYDLSAYTKEIECIFRLIRFLKDKEPKYLETTELGKMKCLLKFREKALRNGSREGFRIMNNWIIETPVRFRKPYGWTNPLKTRLRSNYTLSLLSMRIKDTIRR